MNVWETSEKAAAHPVMEHYVDIGTTAILVTDQDCQQQK